MTSLRALERFARGARRAAPGPCCDLCALAIGEEHVHLVDRVEQKLLCSCQACAIALSAEHGRFRRVGDRIRHDPALATEREAFARVGIPVGLAFLQRSSKRQRWTAFFPSPAGVVEADLAHAAWEAIVSRSPFLSSIEDDVEALLVRTHRDGAFEAFVVPIDRCYALVALVRRHFQGFDGGDGLREAVAQFFETLSSRSERSRV